MVAETRSRSRANNPANPQDPAQANRLERNGVRKSKAKGSKGRSKSVAPRKKTSKVLKNLAEGPSSPTADFLQSYTSKIEELLGQLKDDIAEITRQNARECVCRCLQPTACLRDEGSLDQTDVTPTAHIPLPLHQVAGCSDTLKCSREVQKA